MNLTDNHNAKPLCVDVYARTVHTPHYTADSTGVRAACTALDGRHVYVLTNDRHLYASDIVHHTITTVCRFTCACTQSCVQERVARIQCTCIGADECVTLNMAHNEMYDTVMCVQGCGRVVFVSCPVGCRLCAIHAS